MTKPWEYICRRYPCIQQTRAGKHSIMDPATSTTSTPTPTPTTWLPPLLATSVLLWLSWKLWKLLKYPPPPSFRHRSVAILVLGDIGRSPRMMYHAESFAQIPFETYLIGYGGAVASRTPGMIATILYALLFQVFDPPEFILVQNPPSIPTLAIVWLVSRIRGSKVIIDWHNLGYTILALKLGDKHLFVRLAKKFEAVFGRVAYAHLFVTQAMHDVLVKEWDLVGIKAILHDRPPKHFRRLSAQSVHRLFRELAPHFTQAPLAGFVPSFSLPYSTPFTTTPSTPHPKPTSAQLDSSGTYDKVSPPEMRSDRPALIVSSTSWTPDEDFGILLHALELYEKKARIVNTQPQSQSGNKLPKLVVIITGKGPQKAMYMQKLQKLQAGKGEKGWKWVRCISMWLEAKDYPMLLGSADLGVCLHSSSSALDLPMKVVDMFGCGLPVCALDFPCLHELVKEGINGVTFQTAEQLADRFEELLSSFPNAPALSALRSSLHESSHPPPGTPPPPRRKGKEDVHWEWGTWDDNWNKVVRPIILSDVAKEDAWW
ncbi:mannosyltransferase [Pleurotus pulmonarius]|nr:mannosyltransferase [Pleurotus pulmonarius]